MPATKYVEYIADTVTGTYLDLVSLSSSLPVVDSLASPRARDLTLSASFFLLQGVRTNSVFVRSLPE